MDLQTGTILNWPLAGGWLYNQRILDIMRFTWYTVRHIHETAARSQAGKAWTPSQIRFQASLDQLRSDRPVAPSPYEEWLAANE